MVLLAFLLAVGMDLASLQKIAVRFAPTEVDADVSALPAQDRAALAKIVEAARLMDTLYLRQVWAGNHPLLLELSQDASPLGRARLPVTLEMRLIVMLLPGSLGRCAPPPTRATRAGGLRRRARRSRGIRPIPGRRRRCRSGG